MSDYTYEAMPMRVVFGSGTLAELPNETARLGITRAMVLSTPGHRDLAARASDTLGNVAAGVFDEARMHVPVDTVTAAENAVHTARADGIIAVGGGSTIGLAKALVLRSGLATLAVPTTYAGSEMTPIWGLTDTARKRTGRDRAVLPQTVIYDPELTATLPPSVSATSGLNAIAHAMEALYAPDGSPVVTAMAEHGVLDLAAALPKVVADPGALAARTQALEGAWLCGACLGATTMGLHHKLCHVLGGQLDLPHAATHAVLLPHVAAFNLPAAPSAEFAIQRALDTANAPEALAALADQLGAPRTLAELGVAPNDLPAVIDEVLDSPYSNPRPVSRADLQALLESAWAGAR